MPYKDKEKHRDKINGYKKKYREKNKEKIIWACMKDRCLNHNSTGYRNWGGRGITVCKRWMIFENFFEDMGKQPKNKTLDRIKNNLGYCKSNCKWSSPKEQANNTRKKMLTHNGKTQSIKRWSRELNTNKANIYYRIKNGWDIKKILTK